MRSKFRGIALLCAIIMLFQLVLVAPVSAVKTTASADAAYVLASTVEAGKQYVIVSNGYALTNKTASVSTASGGTSLASTAVTVVNNKITSEVTDDMVWDFAKGESSKAGPYTTGFFITNGASKYLSRGSSSGTGVAPLFTNQYDASNVASKPHYCYWAFQTMDEATSSMSMFLFSSDSSDYVFFARGAAAGFDAPGMAQSNMSSGLSQYQVKLYEKVAGTVEPDPTEPDPTEPETTNPASEAEHSLLFMSDLHAGLEGFTNLKKMIPALKNEGFTPEVIGFGGDYVEDGKGASANWNTVYNNITSIVSATYPNVFSAFTMGNHDWEAIDEAKFKEIFKFDRTGVAYTAEDYEIYMIGAQSNTSGQGKETFWTADITALDNYLASKADSGKAIFVQTHWPLHRGYNWNWRNITNAGQMIDTLNKYGDAMDIVFLWGHNHYTDGNRHTVMTPGSSLTYGDGVSKVIKFIYANVGCMNDMYFRHDGHVDVDVGPGTCLSVGLDSDKITFVYNKIDNGTFSHTADVTLSGVLNTRPAVVVVDRGVKIPEPPKPEVPIYEDTSYSFEERAADLVGRMSLNQKAGLTTSTNAAIAASDLGGGALNVPGTKGLGRYVFWNEALHGFYVGWSGQTANSMSYPQSLTVGTTWNPELYYREATAISDELRERCGKNGLGNAIDISFFSPTVNLQRDPRWGRNEESYAEDPLLVSAMGNQFVLGMEGKDQNGNLLDPNGYYKTHTTIKHYTANNSERNRLVGGATTDLRMLREYFTAPYRNIIQDTNVSSVMTAYSTVNGDPCSYSSYLMDTLLRQVFGFKGFITSDCDSVSTIARLNYVNPYTGKVLTNVEQLAGAMSHGEDIECAGGHSDNVGTYQSLMTSMINGNVRTDKGYFTENTLDIAVHRILTARLQTGEIDDDLAYTKAANERIEAQKAAKPDSQVSNQTDERLALNEEVVNEAVVLLKNNGLLPLQIPTEGSFKVAIVGTWQTETYFGLYTASQNIRENWITIQQGIVNAISAINPNTEFSFITGYSLAESDIPAVQAADVAIVVVGTDGQYSKEDGDRSSIALSNKQDVLISTVGKLNENTIAVMETCGPMQVTTFENDVDAILWSCFGGLRKGVGFGNVITGAVNPSGKVTATWHQNVNDNGVSDIPDILNYNMYNTNGDSGRTYMYYNGETPVSYPFGYGLSYTTFAYSNLKIDKTAYDANDTVTVTFDVTNTGKVAGKEVTQMYIAQPEAPAELLRPIRRLEGFKKIELQPGETKTVTMEVSIPDLAFFNEEADCYKVDTGLYQVQVGTNSAEANLTTNFTVSGAMDVYPALLTVKANQTGDTEAGIEERLIYDLGQTINPQLTVSMNDESLYGYIIANQTSPVKQMKSTALPEGMTFTYKSNRPTVVDVVNGELKCLGVGVATITVTGELNGHVVTTDFVAYVAASTDIDSITVNGEKLEGFKRDAYNYELAYTGTDLPVVAAVSSNPDLKVTVKQMTGVPGVAVVTSTSTASGGSSVYRIGVGSAPVSTNFSEGLAAAQAKGWTMTNGTSNAVFGANGLTITTEQGAVAGEVAAKNMLAQPAFGEWVAQTHISLAEDLNENGPQVGLMVYDDDDNYIQFVYERATTSNGWWTTTFKGLRVYAVSNGETSQIASVSLNGNVTDLHLQIAKRGYEYLFNYSTDGAAWANTGSSATVAMAFPQLTVYAVDGATAAATPLVATFDGISVFKFSELYPRAASISVDGTPLASFDPEVFTYNFEVAADATNVPVITATSADPSHNVEITQLSAATGIAVVKVSTGAGSAIYRLCFDHGPVNDYFADGDMSNAWTILREDAENYRFEQGVGLVMPTQTADIYSTGAAWKNCFTMPGQGNWEVVSKVFYPVIPTGNYQQAMLLVWQDEDNYVRMNCQTGSLSIAPGIETDGSFRASGSGVAVASDDGTVTLYFKIAKAGNEYTLAYSQNGTDFTNVTTISNVNFANPKIGLFVTQNSSVTPVDMAYEYVAVTSRNGITQMSYAEMLAWAAQNAADYIAAALPATASENIQLAAAPHGYTVELISSNPAVIAADGTVTPAAKTENVQLTVKVSEGDTVATATVSVTVPGTQGGEALAIVTQPAAYVGALNTTATFAVEATGEGLTYQWMYSNNGGKSFAASTLPGATTATLNVALAAFRDGQMYKCVVTDVNGETVTSQVVTMRVIVPAEKLAITSNPASYTGAVGTTATFAVEATGEGLTYQWMYSNNGGKSFVKSTMSGADSASLNVEYKAFRAGQVYKCVVTDISGNRVESATATLGTK